MYYGFEVPSGSRPSYGILASNASSHEKQMTSNWIAFLIKKADNLSTNIFSLLSPLSGSNSWSLVDLPNARTTS
jgi:hypothetical protein